MNKILLFADIGGHEQERYYHVGDEAMFQETSNWYLSNLPHWKISALTWSTKKKNGINFSPHLLWLQKPSWLFFLLFILKILIYKIFTLSLFSKIESTWFQNIKNQNLIHFSGGGNLSSNFRKWLYYCFIVLLVAKLFKIKVILTSQTLGPFNKFDLIIAQFLLGQAQLIGIRSKIDNLSIFSQLNISQTKLVSMLDSAYVPQSTSTKTKNKNYFRIGLSLHQWKSTNSKTKHLMKALLKKIKSQYPVRLILIPHHISQNKKGTDIDYMKSIMTPPSLTSKKSWAKICYKFANHHSPNKLVKAVTAKVDLLITSRYHGLVFALSQNIPTIAINYDQYYKNKNIGILEMIYENNFGKYTVDFSDKKNKSDFSTKVSFLLKNNAKEKKKLQLINKKIYSDKNSLDSVMRNLDLDN